MANSRVSVSGCHNNTSHLRCFVFVWYIPTIMSEPKCKSLSAMQNWVNYSFIAFFASTWSRCCFSLLCSYSAWQKNQFECAEIIIINMIYVTYLRWHFWRGFVRILFHFARDLASSIRQRQFRCCRCHCHSNPANPNPFAVSYLVVAFDSHLWSIRAWLYGLFGAREGGR